MPFVFDRSAQLERSAKRRKLYHIIEMARSSLEEDSERAWLESGESSGQADPAHQSTNSESEKEEIRTSSREELIECIKRGQKPTWVPKPTLQALCEEEDALQEKRNALKTETGAAVPQLDDIERIPKQVLGHHLVADSTPEDLIERPPSALHRGDFSETNGALSSGHSVRNGHHSDPFLSTSTSFSGSPPWPLHGLQPAFGQALSDVHDRFHGLQKLQTRRRAPSVGSSLSSSFVMRVPTSPLVHATTHDYLDLEDGELKKPTTKNAEFANRRRTMPPNSFHSFSTSFMEATPPNFSRPLPSSLRRESSMPEQSHQPRRSLSSFTYQPRSNPASPLPRSRRPSTGSETSLRRRSSMVGSFEESILRGRMSTPPSKPLNFVAQIGVMGKGECPSYLKCPAHVTVPFPAVFYSYESTTTSRSLIDDAPSPYVGTIDLEHGLKQVILRTKPKAVKQNGIVQSSKIDLDNNNDLLNFNAHTEQQTRDLVVGGAYRVPKQGQLQIILKNPNKTAVKLFLVPYDLTGMEAGTKTFVRQRSFSSGPIIEKALSDKADQPTVLDPMEEKLILRYLVHVKFCCPAKDRYYLYDNIRVVFANRVPDGKEKLRNEIQLPDPKFSIFKPADANSKPVKLVDHVNINSNGYSPPTSPSRILRNMDVLDGIGNNRMLVQMRQQKERVISFQRSHIRSSSYNNNSSPVTTRNGVQDDHLRDVHNMEMIEPERTVSPVTGFKASDRTRASPIPWTPSSGSSTTRSYSPAPAEFGDGLLSRKFRELNEQASALGHRSTHESLMENDAASVASRREDMSRDGDIGLAHTFYIRSDQVKEAF